MRKRTHQRMHFDTKWKAFPQSNELPIVQIIVSCMHG